ncbi:MAG TPA: CocE/NonD family hydrolase [Pyrinomonadaceae bacterium]|nr:CocE/NonD family hydrolase [Pyrinomonadaceae bacterium]
MNKNRLLRLFAVIAFVVAAHAASLAQAQLTPQQQLADYIKNNYTKREVLIPMRDGVRLFTSIYEPKDASQKYPILLNRTPYTVAPYGADNYKTSLGPDELFAREGYVFVYQDVRGCWMSEGEFEDARPYVPNKSGKQIDETTDTYDTVEWLVHNVANNNGRVGVYGISYPGFYTSMAGIDSHPAVKAISPQAPVSDWFHGDDLHHNGALFLAQNYGFFAFFGQPRPQPHEPSPAAFKPFPFGTDDGYKFFLEMGGLKNSGDLFEQKIGTRIKFWDEMMAHPNYDEFWRAHNILPNLKNIHAAVMTVGGWYDDEDLFGALNTYRHVEQQNPGIFNVLVMGPWFHGGWVRSDGDWLGTAYFGGKTGLYYRQHFELPFFNHFLKDKGDISQIKEVNVFDTGADEWRDFNGWSPDASVETPLYLQANGKLSFSKAAGDAAFDEYVSDPMRPVPYTQKTTLDYPHDFMTEDQRFAARRSDVLVYQTEPLDSDVTIAGDIKPQLFVSSSGTDSDFVVKLIDVFPDDYKYPAGVVPPADSSACVFQPGGYEMLLRGEPFPARFRDGFENPRPLQPDAPVKISYVMPGVVHTFKKGHRIMIQIQSTWFPLVARNPQKFVTNYQLGTDADFRKATERVYHDGARASLVVLPVVKK